MRQIHRQKQRNTDRPTKRERQTDRQRQREGRDRETDRDRKTETKRERQTDRQTQRQREGERQSETERERIRNGPTNNSNGLQTVNLRLRGFHASFSFLINLTSRSVKLYSYVSTHGGQRSYSPLSPSPSIRYGLAINTSQGCSL